MLHEWRHESRIEELGAMKAFSETSTTRESRLNKWTSAGPQLMFRYLQVARICAQAQPQRTRQPLPCDINDHLTIRQMLSNGSLTKSEAFPQTGP